MTPDVSEFAVFVKPWKDMTLEALGAHVHGIGFRWIELPVRPGFPCQPETIEQDLPKAVSILGEHDVHILNVTVSLPMDDERVYAACSAAGVGMNRVMMRRGNENYWEAEKRAREELDAALPLCEEYDVQIGVQNHAGNFVGVNAFGLYNLVKAYDRRYVGAVWDAAHNALEGMDPEPALDVVESHLCVVNLKNGYWRRISGPEAEVAQWKVYWTSGRAGRASWARVAAKVKAMDYTGPICLTAEYSDESAIDRLIVEDLAFAKALFE